MKILVVCQFYYPENFVITPIAESLVSFGHDVTVLTGKPNYGYGKILPEYKNVKEEEINGVHIKRVKLYPRSKSRLSIIRNYLSFWRNSKRWVRKCKEEYDVVYSLSLSPVTILSAGNLYCKKHHKKHVVHCVDLWPESVLITHAVRKNSLLYKIIYKWSKKLYHAADKVLVGSPSFKEYFRDVLSIDPSTISFVPQPSLVEHSQEQSYPFDKEYFHILYCGNLGIIQQIPFIAEAMNELKEEKIKFHIIGMGPKLEELQNLIKKYDLNNIVYYGPMPAKKAAPYFLGVDALYVSLKNEGVVGKTIPNKLVMSMAFEKPIVAMLEGDGKDILQDAEGGILVQQNPASLVKGLKEAMALSQKEKDRLGKNNGKYYRDHFSIEKVTRQIEKYLFEETH